MTQLFLPSIHAAQMIGSAQVQPQLSERVVVPTCAESVHLLLCCHTHVSCTGPCARYITPSLAHVTLLQRSTHQSATYNFIRSRCIGHWAHINDATTTKGPTCCQLTAGGANRLCSLHIAKLAGHCCQPHDHQQLPESHAGDWRQGHHLQWAAARQ